MIATTDIKAIVTPQSLARYLLGSPVKERRNELWYKSPFRRETEASFVVSDRGFHDFGTDEHYDIFSFVQKLKHCSFKDSVEALASMYGVADREYDSKELLRWHRTQREAQLRYEQELRAIYLAIWDEVDAELREVAEDIELIKGRKEYIDAYKILLDRKVSAWGMNEYLAQDIDNMKDKEELKQKVMKGELPTWLMDRLRAHTTILQNMPTKQNLRREY